ncbi:MAG: cation diffusion facilitator family transporter [Pseudoxanthomonas sp.]
MAHDHGAHAHSHPPAQPARGHAHGHGHGHDHDHAAGDPAAVAARGYALVLAVNLAYTALETGYGFYADSLALLSDALHNLGDVLGLALAWGAALLARRAPAGRHTYGWRRATLLSPLANSTLLMVFCGALAWEAVRRFAQPPQVPPLPMIVVAAIGIAVNLGSGWLLHRAGAGHAHAHGHGDLNRRGAVLHLLADAAVSLAAVLAGLGIWWLGWQWLDPATGLLVGAVIAASSFGLLRESLAAAMDAAPAHIDLDEMAGFLAGLPGVTAVHHVHVWSLGASEVALTAHLVRPAAAGHDAFLDLASQALAARYGIRHATLQVELGEQDCGQACALDADHGH